MGTHLHTVSADGAKDVRAEHAAWHASKRPCLFCGAVSWTTCAVDPYPAHLSATARPGSCYGTLKVVVPDITPAARTRWATDEIGRGTR